MAKLNGVKVVAEAIEYNGVRYEKVEGVVRVGDIVRAMTDDYVDVAGGEFYEVVSGDYPHLIDDVGDERGFDKDLLAVERDDFDVFRKVTEPQALQHREVNRAAKVGERIKIVEPYMSGGRYKKGDELIVYSVDTDGSGDVRIMINGERTLISRKEYVVLEPIAEQADDIIEVDGVKYRKVDRAPKVGDFVYTLKDDWDLTEGSVYEIRRLDSDGDGVFRDDVGDSQFIQKNTNTLLLVERIATAEDLERQVSELQTKLSEAEAELAAKKAEEEAAKRLTVGEYAKVIGGNNHHTKIGDIVIIRSVDFAGDYEINSLDGRKLDGFKFAKNLVRATDEEVAEAKRKLELSKFTEGTYVKLTVEEGKRPRHGWGDVKNGEVGVVSGVNGSTIYADFPSQKRWNADPSELTILTAEEAEETIKRAEEVAKWAAIGRKVGEFKEGDLIEITCYQGGDRVGTIAPVVSVLSDRVYYKSLNARLGKYCGSKDAIKLIAPVESVVNLAVSN